MKRIINRRAGFNYQLLERFEAGLVLTGAEVKSIRDGQMDLSDSYVRLLSNELWLINAHISQYRFSQQADYNPKRSRKLLLKKREILKIAQNLQQKNLTLIPVSCYNKARHLKLEIALAKADGNTKNGRLSKKESGNGNKRDGWRETDRKLIGS